MILMTLISLTFCLYAVFFFLFLAVNTYTLIHFHFLKMILIVLVQVFPSLNAFNEHFNIYSGLTNKKLLFLV